MARMPDANFLGEQSPREPMDHYDIVCLHTIVGSAPAHAAHFSTHADGRIDQSRDTRFQSGANLDGNPRVIAIENEDRGGPFPDWNIDDPHAVPKFTDEQVEACAKILAWAHKVHGIPLQLCPNSKPGSRGLAYHRQGIPGAFNEDARFKFPGLVAGGEIWTETPGKACPGDRRIDQRSEILARAKQLEDDMPSINDLLSAKLNPDEDESETVRSALNKGADALAEVRGLSKGFGDFRENLKRRDQALAEAIDAIAADLTDVATKQQLDRVREALADTSQPVS